MKKLALIVVVAAALTACEREMPEVGGTGAEKVANEWWVTLAENGTALSTPFQIATYNTANHQDSLWIDDLKHGYGFKSKVKVDLGSLSFAAANTQSLYYNPLKPTSFPQTVSIANGKILPDAAKSKTGNVTDSIYMEIEYANKPGKKYTLSGHARTKLAEDEY